MKRKSPSLQMQKPASAVSSPARLKRRRPRDTPSSRRPRPRRPRDLVDLVRTNRAACPVEAPVFWRRAPPPGAFSRRAAAILEEVSALSALSRGAPELKRRRHETAARRVDSHATASTASRRRGMASTPSTRPRQVQGWFLRRVADRRVDVLDFVLGRRRPAQRELLRRALFL